MERRTIVDSKALYRESYKHYKLGMEHLKRPPQERQAVRQAIATARAEQLRTSIPAKLAQAALIGSMEAVLITVYAPRANRPYAPSLEPLLDEELWKIGVLIAETVETALRADPSVTLNRRGIVSGARSGFDFVVTLNISENERAEIRREVNASSEEAISPGDLDCWGLPRA